MITGIVLAAGAGRRFGAPKAFETADDGRTWVARAAQTLVDGGCDQVIVTLPELRDLEFADPLRPIVVPSSGGQSASLRAALDAVPAGAEAVMITLVDLPDVDVPVIRRILGSADPVTSEVLIRAGFQGRPGHPVLIGRAHFAPLRATLVGDQGARAYLREHSVELVECGDLATGADVDER